MTRYVLIRRDSTEEVVPETAVPLEAELHDALTTHPELIPADDLGLEAPRVVGRESGLESGYVDLVLLDRRGQVCLVEVKKEGNPDTRRVVAQLLDYAASLWGCSLAEFERVVLHPFISVKQAGGTSLPALAEFVATEFGDDEDDPDARVELGTAIATALEASLAAGRFKLVVAAPAIPDGVQRALEYLNAQGLAFYGLEVSYFAGPAECFVPRLVVRPTAADPATSTKPAPVAEEAFFESLPDRAREPVREFLAKVVAVGALVEWKAYGPSVLVQRDARRQVASVQTTGLTIVVKATKGFPDAPFATTADELQHLGVGTVSKDGWYHTIRFNDVSDGQLDEALSIAASHVERIVPAHHFAPIDPPTEATFTRTDHAIIWEKHVPAIEPFKGHHLRGELERTATGAIMKVHLAPLAAGSPGWRVRPRGTGDWAVVWPPEIVQEPYRLVVSAVAAPES